MQTSPNIQEDKLSELLLEVLWQVLIREVEGEEIKSVA
jgi:hypothetical protein